MKSSIQILTLGAVLLMLNGCILTDSSRIVVGQVRPAIDPASVRLYLRSPAKFEEIAILTGESRNAFASQQALTDAAIERMKKEAAAVGANGILLGGIGDQAIGSVGSGFGQTSTYGTANASAYSTGNTTTAYGTGQSTALGNSVGVNTPIVKKAASGMAIYVLKE